MKAEKKVRTYTRRTKAGKTVTVKAHTAKYEAADKKDAAKKKGAGKELEERKKKSKVENLFDKEEEKKILDEGKTTKKADSTKSVLKGNSKLHRWFKESPKAFSKVSVQKSRMSGDYHIHLADGSGQVYDSKEAANKDAKLLRSMYKEWSTKRPKLKGPSARESVSINVGTKEALRRLGSQLLRNPPTKVDAGKSVMNLPTKGIPTYPVKSEWGRMSARQIRSAKEIMEQTGISKKEAIKAVMETPKRAKGSVKRRPLPKRRGGYNP